MKYILTALTIYISIGIYFSLFGIMKEKINTEVSQTRMQCLLDPEAKAIPDYKFVLLRILLTLGSIILWPWFVLEHFLGKLNQSTNRIQAPPGLMFSMVSGYGVYKCFDCGKQGPLTGSTHDHNELNPTVEIGHQCQSCGKFKNIKNPENGKTYSCDCGGTLSNRLPIFCPGCRSKNIRYNLQELT